MAARRRRRHNPPRRRSRARTFYRHRRSNPVMYFQRRRHRSNPARRHSRRRRYSRSRHNPALISGRGVTGYLTTSLWAIAGMVGARAGTQAVLGARNTGPIGYVANGVAAIVLGQLVGRGLRNRAAGVAVTVGGFLGIVARAIQEFTPFGSYVTKAFGTSGLGDWGISGMGEYIPSAFFQPMQQQNTQWPQQVIPAVIGEQARAAVMAAAPAPMRGLGVRTAGSRMDVTRF